MTSQLLYAHLTNGHLYTGHEEIKCSEDGGSKVLRNVGILGGHDPEDIDLDLHHCENHKPRET